MRASTERGSRGAGARWAAWVAVAVTGGGLAVAAAAVARPHAAAAVPRCTVDDVRLIYTGNGGAAGTLFTRFHFLHRGAGRCTMRGYPAVTLVGRGGRPLAIAVGRDRTPSVTTRVLSRGHPAYFTIVHPAFDRRTSKPCATVPRAFRIVAPGQTAAFTLSAERTERFCKSGARVTPVGAQQ